MEKSTHTAPIPFTIISYLVKKVKFLTLQITLLNKVKIDIYCDIYRVLTVTFLIVW